MSKVRTRFAPSPTGYMHIGNLRTALYGYLYAKNQGGKFILRIEDTDQERYVADACDVIFGTLKQCGLNWDEGPDKDGGCGPYVQSERRAHTPSDRRRCQAATKAADARFLCPADFRYIRKKF